MVFITLGSQKFQFNRLLKAVDALVESGAITEKVFAQTGFSDYEPRFYQYKNFVDRDEFARITGEADIVITHGGTGAIIGAVRKGKKVIAVPRLAKYGEHVDDHQTQIVEEFGRMGLILPCTDCSRLDEAVNDVYGRHFTEYHTNTDRFLDILAADIEGRPND